MAQQNEPLTLFKKKLFHKGHFFYSTESLVNGSVKYAMKLLFDHSQQAILSFMERDMIFGQATYFRTIHIYLFSESVLLG